MNMEFNPHYRKWFLTDVIRAVEKYSLVDQGEKICVALSGGKDSAVLLYILRYLKAYSHLAFDLCALHVRTEDYDTSVLRELCCGLGVEYRETSLTGQREFPWNPCYLCGRLKRGAMVEALSGTGIRKVAYGHHADDAAETLLMNIIHNRKLGSFCPRVEVPGAELVIIRPMIYLEELRIAAIHRRLGLPVLEYRCPYGADNPRSIIRQGLKDMEALFRTQHFSKSIVAALENLDYSNLWKDVQGK
jgi:tRNA(Ile)-lysidine synthase TilS/MesJ